MEDELRQLLRESRHSARRRWNCADESQLAAYIDGGLDANERTRLEAHLAGCHACLALAAFLVRTSEAPLDVGIPQDVLRRAKELVGARAKRNWSFDWRWAAATATACLVLAAITVIGIRLRTTSDSSVNGNVIAQQPSPNATLAAPPSVNPRNPDVVVQSSTPIIAKPTGPRPESSVAVVRGAEPPNGGPKLLSPRDGAVEGRDSITFRWQSVRDAESYEVSVMTASGDVVMSRLVKGESTNMPPDFRLQPRTKYFVSIRAHLRDGKTMRSNVVSFRVQ